MKNKGPIYYVKTEELPSKGMFYPNDLTIWITPLNPSADMSEWNEATKSMDMLTLRDIMNSTMREHIHMSSLSQGEFDFYDMVEPDQLAMLAHIRRASGYSDIKIQLDDGTKIDMEPTDLRTLDLDAPMMTEKYDVDMRRFHVWCGIDRCIPMFIPTIGIGMIWCRIATEYAEAFNNPVVASNVISLITVTSLDWREFSENSLADNLKYVESYNAHLNGETQQVRRIMYETMNSIRGMIGFRIMYKGELRKFDFDTPFTTLLKP